MVNACHCNMKIDTSKMGLSKFFRDHELEVLRVFWETPGQVHTSKDVWEAVNKRLNEESVSRATIINFLESVAEMGLIERDTDTCRGGHRGLYVNFKTEIDVQKLLIERLFRDIQRDFSLDFKKFGNNQDMN